MVRPFDDADRPAIRALLETAGLPVPHPDEAPVRFWVAEERDRVVGCAGTEDHGDFTLIRSVAIEARSRGRSWGSRLIEAILADLDGRGRGDLSLVTIDAAGFFERFGFRAVSREAVPEPIRASPEFRIHACVPGTWMRRTRSSIDQPQL
jgi:amino-acid N-acetyltransferase